MNVTDNDLRSLVLRKYYDRRGEGEVQWKTEDFADVEDSWDFNEQDLYRVCEQLAEANLIEWHPLEGGNGRTITGYGRIRGMGVDVIEGNTVSPIPIQIDQSRHYNIRNGHHNIIGDRNVQVGDISIEQLARAIDSARASDEEKKKARTVLKRAFEHPIVNTLVGAAAQAAAKAFTGV
jgi:hypothetical protein